MAQRRKGWKEAEEGGRECVRALLAPYIKYADWEIFHFIE